MNSTAAFAATMLVSAGVAFAIVTFSKPEAQKAAPQLAELEDAEARAEIEALKRQIADLTRRQETASSATGAAARTAVAEDIDARIEAAVARALQAEADPETPSDFNVDAMVVELLDGHVHPSVNPEAWARIKEAGQIDAVVAAFKRRAEENPNDAEAQAQYGEALLTKIWEADNVMDQGRFGGMADAAWTKALELDPNHWNARFNKAVSYTFWPEITGKPAEAVTHFETLMTQQEAGPDRGHTGFVETYMMLGNMYQAQGKADKAREVFERGLRYHPDDKRLRDKLK